MAVMTWPKLAGSGLPASSFSMRLGVEQIEVARPAFHEQEDDALGGGAVVRQLGRERRRQIGSAAKRRAAQKVAIATAPNPAPARASRSRRENGRSVMGLPGIADAGSVTRRPSQLARVSVHVKELVRVQQDVAEIDQRLLLLRLPDSGIRRPHPVPASAACGHRPADTPLPPASAGSDVPVSWRSRAANAAARFSGQSPLIISSAWLAVVVTLRTGTLPKASGESKASSSGSRVLRRTLV